MHAILRICGNESQLGLQLVKELATPLTGVQREGEEEAELSNRSIAINLKQLANGKLSYRPSAFSTLGL